MTDNPEEIVDQNLHNDDKDRQIQTDVGDSSWGQLIIPSESESQSKGGEDIRVALPVQYSGSPVPMRMFVYGGFVPS